MTEPAKPPVPPAEEWDQTGLCEEAQADGVPCFELGRRCDTCERARCAALPPPKPGSEKK